MRKVLLFTFIWFFALNSYAENSVADGIDKAVSRMFEVVSRQINFSSWSSGRLGRYIVEHNIFSRDNAPLLDIAAKATVLHPEISGEFLRNYKEEMGSGFGDIPHFQIYLDGLLKIGIENESQHSEAMRAYVGRMTDLLRSKSLSQIVGAFYASEAAAVPELLLIKRAIEAYANTAGVADMPEKLLLYFNIHLNGVEESHKQGIRRFIDNDSRYGLNEFEIQAGARAAIEAMTKWWLAIEKKSKSTCVDFFSGFILKL